MGFDEEKRRMVEDMLVTMAAIQANLGEMRAGCARLSALQANLGEIKAGCARLSAIHTHCTPSNQDSVNGYSVISVADQEDDDLLEELENSNDETEVVDAVEGVMVAEDDAPDFAASLASQGKEELPSDLEEAESDPVVSENNNYGSSSWNSLQINSNFDNKGTSLCSYMFPHGYIFSTLLLQFGQMIRAPQLFEKMPDRDVMGSYRLGIVNDDYCHFTLTTVMKSWCFDPGIHKTQVVHPHITYPCYEIIVATGRSCLGQSIYNGDLETRASLEDALITLAAMQARVDEMLTIAGCIILVVRSTGNDTITADLNMGYFLLSIRPLDVFFVGSSSTCSTRVANSLQPQQCELVQFLNETLCSSDARDHYLLGSWKLYNLISWLVLGYFGNIWFLFKFPCAHSLRMYMVIQMQRGILTQGSTVVTERRTSPAFGKWYNTSETNSLDSFVLHIEEDSLVDSSIFSVSEGMYMPVGTKPCMFVKLKFTEFESPKPSVATSLSPVDASLSPVDASSLNNIYSCLIQGYDSATLLTNNLLMGIYDVDHNSFSREPDPLLPMCHITNYGALEPVVELTPGFLVRELVNDILQDDCCSAGWSVRESAIKVVNMKAVVQGFTKLCRLPQDSFCNVSSVRGVSLYIMRADLSKLLPAINIALLITVCGDFATANICKFFYVHAVQQAVHHPYRRSLVGLISMAAFIQRLHNGPSFTHNQVLSVGPGTSVVTSVVPVFHISVFSKVCEGKVVVTPSYLPCLLQPFSIIWPWAASLRSEQVNDLCESQYGHVLLPRDIIICYIKCWLVILLCASIGSSLSWVSVKPDMILFVVATWMNFLRPRAWKFLGNAVWDAQTINYNCSSRPVKYKVCLQVFSREYNDTGLQFHFNDVEGFVTTRWCYWVYAFISRLPEDVETGCNLTWLFKENFTLQDAKLFCPCNGSSVPELTAWDVPSSLCIQSTAITSINDGLRRRGSLERVVADCYYSPKGSGSSIRLGHIPGHSHKEEQSPLYICNTSVQVSLWLSPWYAEHLVVSRVAIHIFDPGIGTFCQTEYTMLFHYWIKNHLLHFLSGVKKKDPTDIQVIPFFLHYEHVVPMQLSVRCSAYSNAATLTVSQGQSLVEQVSSVVSVQHGTFLHVLLEVHFKVGKVSILAYNNWCSIPVTWEMSLCISNMRASRIFVMLSSTSIHGMAIHGRKDNIGKTHHHSLFTASQKYSIDRRRQNC